MTISKLLTLTELRSWREGVAGWGKRLVVTNGCFDILHAGHVGYLRQARALGDVLLVGLNSDESVRALKGQSRPINHDMDRAEVLAGLESVDAICIFEDPRAHWFLGEASPDVYVKGGDYTLEKLDPLERGVLQTCGANIRFIDLLPGRSTTAILSRDRQTR